MNPRNIKPGMEGQFGVLFGESREGKFHMT